MTNLRVTNRLTLGRAIKRARPLRKSAIARAQQPTQPPKINQTPSSRHLGIKTFFHRSVHAEVDDILSHLKHLTVSLDKFEQKIRAHLEQAHPSHARRARRLLWKIYKNREQMDLEVAYRLIDLQMFVQRTEYIVEQAVRLIVDLGLSVSPQEQIQAQASNDIEWLDVPHELGRIIQSRRARERRLYRPLKLFNYQDQALRALWQYYKLRDSVNGALGSHALVELPTGSGKTHVMAAFVQSLMNKNDFVPKKRGDKVVILTHKKIITEQHLQKFQELLPGLKVSRFDSEKDLTGDVVVVSIPSVIVFQAIKGRDNKFRTDMAHSVRMFIQSLKKSLGKSGVLSAIEIDEYHHYAEANSWKLVIDQLEKGFPESRIAGFTATPHPDGIQPIYQKSFIDLARQGAIPNPLVYSIQIPGTFDGIRVVAKTQEFNSNLQKKLNQDHVRRFILEEIYKKRLVRPDKKGLLPTLAIVRGNEFGWQFTQDYAEFFTVRQNILERLVHRIKRDLSESFPDLTKGELELWATRSALKELQDYEWEEPADGTIDSQDPILNRRLIATAADISQKELDLYVEAYHEGVLTGLACHVTSRTSSKILNQILKLHAEGVVELIVSDSRLNEGYNGVSQVQLNIRPTRSSMRLIQDLGRNLRYTDDEVDIETGEVLKVKHRYIFDFRFHILPLPSLHIPDVVGVVKQTLDFGNGNTLVQLGNAVKRRSSSNESSLPNLVNRSHMEIWNEVVLARLSQIIANEFDGIDEDFLADIRVNTDRLKLFLMGKIELTRSEIQQLEFFLFMDQGSLLGVGARRDKAIPDNFYLSELLRKAYQYYYGLTEKPWKDRKLDFVVDGRTYKYSIPVSYIDYMNGVGNQVFLSGFLRLGIALYYNLKNLDHLDEDVQSFAADLADQLDQIRPLFFQTDTVWEVGGRILWDPTYSGLKALAAETPFTENKIRSIQDDQFAQEGMTGVRIAWLKNKGSWFTPGARMLITTEGETIPKNGYESVFARFVDDKPDQPLVVDDPSKLQGTNHDTLKMLDELGLLSVDENIWMNLLTVRTKFKDLPPKTEELRELFLKKFKRSKTLYVGKVNNKGYFSPKSSGGIFVLNKSQLKTAKEENLNLYMLHSVKLVSNNKIEIQCLQSRMNSENYLALCEFFKQLGFEVVSFQQKLQAFTFMKIASELSDQAKEINELIRKIAVSKGKPTAVYLMPDSSFSSDDSINGGLVVLTKDEKDKREDHFSQPYLYLEYDDKSDSYIVTDISTYYSIYMYDLIKVLNLNCYSLSYYWRNWTESDLHEQAHFIREGLLKIIKRLISGQSDGDNTDVLVQFGSSMALANDYTTSQIQIDIFTEELWRKRRVDRNPICVLTVSDGSLSIKGQEYIYGRDMQTLIKFLNDASILNN